MAYDVQTANSNKSNLGERNTTVTSSDATIIHDFITTLMVKFRARTEVGSATSI